MLNVLISPSSAEVLQGDSQTITCTVSGSPQATAITWTRTTTGGPVTLNVQSLPGKYSGGTVVNPSLTISNFATTDAGSYICKATNAVGIASSLTSVLSYKGKYCLPITPPLSYLKIRTIIQIFVQTNISLRCEVEVHNTSLSLPLFIEVPVPNK